MPQRNPKTLADAAFDRLLSQHDLHGPRHSACIRQAQLLCGRWLALRRLRLGITSESLAGRAEIPAEVLLFVELGLADATLVPDQSRACLGQLLAGAYRDGAWVDMVLAIALGRIQTPSDRIMRRVVADLDAVCDTPQADKK